LHYTPYWSLEEVGVPSGGACVSEAPGGWTLVQAAGPGRLHVVADFSLTRVFERGPTCAETPAGR
jgi:hypothetical protein